MNDLKSILRSRSERGTPIGSARLRDRVVVELAGGSPFFARRLARKVPGPVFAASVAAVVLIGFGGVLLLLSPGGGSGESLPFAAQPTTTEAAPPTTEAAPPTTEAAPPTTEVTPPTTGAVEASTDADFYEVTMELLGDEGFATTCGRLVMRAAYGSSGNSFVADGAGGSSVPRLFLSASEELIWQRDFPEPVSGEGFGVVPSDEECHGGAVEGSPLPRDGLLTIDVDDGVVDVLWHFDHYYRTEGTASVIENFTIRGEAPAEWTESADGERSMEVSGEFNIGWFQNLDGEVIHGYVPFEGSPRPFHFRLTVTPTSDSISFEEALELDEVAAPAAMRAEAWNAAAQELGIENLTMEKGTSWLTEEQYQFGVETEWVLSNEAISARLTHSMWGTDLDGSDPDESWEFIFWLDSGYETEPGQSLLLDATRIMILVMEPTLSDLEREELASRLLTPEDFAYEELGRTMFMSVSEDDSWRWVLAQWIN